MPTLNPDLPTDIASAPNQAKPSASASSPSSQPSGPSYPSGELSTIEDTHGAQVLYFEHDFCQSFIDGRQGSNACTVISSLNILRWLERDQQFPDSLRVIPCVAGSLDQCLGHRCHAHPNRTPELVVYQHTIGRVSAHNWSCISTQFCRKVRKISKNGMMSQKSQICSVTVPGLISSLGNKGEES